MKSFQLKKVQKFALGLVMIAGLSACGRGMNTGQPLAQGQKPVLVDTSKKLLSKGENRIAVDQAPGDGWTEIQAAALKGDASINYKLAQIQQHVVKLRDSGVASGAAAITTVESDPATGELKMTQDIPCKDLQADDRFPLTGSPQLAFNAATGEYSQRIKIDILVTATKDIKSATLKDLKTKGMLYTDLESYPADRQAAQARGDDLTVRFYQNKDGQVEMRVLEVAHDKVNLWTQSITSAVRWMPVAPKTK